MNLGLQRLKILKRHQIVQIITKEYNLTMAGLVLDEFKQKLSKLCKTDFKTDLSKSMDEWMARGSFSTHDTLAYTNFQLFFQ